MIKSRLCGRLYGVSSRGVSFTSFFTIPSRAINYVCAYGRKMLEYKRLVLLNLI